MLLFARQFYGSLSTFLWEVELRIVNHVQQGEGGEQGNGFTPMLRPRTAFCFGRDFRAIAGGKAPFRISRRSRHQIVPELAVECSHILRQELWRHCRISLNNGKIRLWNRAGFSPQGCEALEDAARVDDPEAVVWKGNPELPRCQQGIKILGVP